MAWKKAEMDRSTLSPMSPIDVQHFRSLDFGGVPVESVETVELESVVLDAESSSTAIIVKD